MRDDLYLQALVEQEAQEWRKNHMRKATLTREPTTDEGTFGSFVLDDGTTFVSGELPWRNNVKTFSCIPVGRYICKWIDSPKHGPCYQVTNVTYRNMIEIHSANWMGDVTLRYFNQLEGCIALGKSKGMLAPEGYMAQMAILQSKQAIAEFEENMNQEDFELTIV